MGILCCYLDLFIPMTQLIDMQINNLAEMKTDD